MYNKAKKGFTLIELLIVIAIIGILAVAFLPSILGAPTKARDTKRVADLTNVQEALIFANLQGEAYPATGCVSGQIAGAALTSLGGQVPMDPNEGGAGPWTPGADGGAACGADYDYEYIKAPSSDYSFGLYAKLETVESANSSCASLAADPVNVGGAPADATDACYAILVQ